MAKFMVLYKSTVPAAEMMGSSTPEQLEAGIKAWMEWAQNCGPALVDLGSPLSGGKKVSAAGVEDISSPIGGFSILEADTIEAATALVEKHPHFMGPGEPTIVVLEYLPVAGM